MTITRAGRRVCLFGGSFDPPHVCHTLAAVWALQTLPIDEVWWVLTYDHAFGKQLRPWEDRLAMVRATTQDFQPAMQVSQIERELGGVSRTIDTVRALKERYPLAEFSLLIGSDLVDQVPTWKEADALLQLADLYVIGREGTSKVDADALVLPNVSSTALRAAIAEGNRDFYLPRLARPVVHLIEEKGWYSE